MAPKKGSMPDANTTYSTLGQGPRFFAAPRTDIFDREPQKRSNYQLGNTAKKERQVEKKMRYAAYIRISSEDQVGNYSLDAQQRAIEAWVAAKGGILVKIYKDEAQSGRNTDRPAFQQMRLEARKKSFDALVVHKFDRFARNRTDALAIKSLLRYDFGVKVFSVSEPSEDSDGPMGALIEGIMESVADWYSRNLATEVAKGKKERSHQGKHNNGAPFGYKKDKDKILVADELEAPGLQFAFDQFATGQYSDTDIAVLLNNRGYKTKKGRPFSKDTIRAILQNPTYLGKIKYQQVQRNADGSRNQAGPVEWFEGQHDPLVSDELFQKCLALREKRAHHRQPTIKYNSYLLRDIVYCYRCCTNHPAEKTFRTYGKMRAQTRRDRDVRFYRCRATELGYSCLQKGVYAETLDAQVLHILRCLKPPKLWRETITKSIGEVLGEQDLEKRLAEIREVIQRMDQRWDLGFITNEQDYIRQRLELQQELEKLIPVDNNDLEQAADLIQNFGQHWQACGEDAEAQHELVKRIVERVYIQDEEVVAMTLKSNCHLVLGHNVNGPTEYTVDPFLDSIAPLNERYTSGSDGI